MAPVFGSGGAALAAVCASGPAPEQPFDIEAVEQRTTYDFTRNLAQIAALRALPPGSHNLHALGTTEINFSAGFRLTVSETPTTGGMSCVRITGGRVTFNLDRVAVYVASEFPSGACAHAAILEHEEGHVAISRRVFRDSLARLTVRLEAARLQGFSVSASSLEEGRAQLTRMMSALVDDETANFKAEQARLNALHDQPESIARTTAECPSGSFDPPT